MVGLVNQPGANRAREDAQLLDMAERMSGLGHWRYWVSDGRVEWSEQVYVVHGVSSATFDPNIVNAVDFYHEDDRPALSSCLAQAIETGEGFEFDLRIRRADGDLRNVLCKAECHRDVLGQVEALFGVFQDITDHKHSLAKLERAKARHKLLTDHIADMVVQFSLRGGSGYVSPSAERLLGYTPIEIAQMPALEFITPEHRATMADILRAMAAGRETDDSQYQVVRKDGHRVWVETRLQLIRDADGAPDAVVAVIRDISARKALEEELRLAKAEAEVSAAAKGEFLANMSHELRTPLTSLTGFTRLATEQPELSDLTRTYLSRATEAGNALLSTVNDILDFSKLEAGQIGLEPRPVRLEGFGQATLDLFAPQAAAKDLIIRLDAEVDTQDRAILLDPDRVRQILLNLVGNAVKFTEVGEVVVKVRHDAQALSLRVDVVDSGPGIAVDLQQRLFKRFSQVDSSLTRSHGGSGLGLAICKGLVEAMGGTIGVESSAGKGSRFWFEIPAPLATWAPPEEAGSAQAAAIFGGARILVVDDHPTNRELARLFLEGLGASVVEADGGVDGVRRAEEAPFDIILMDMRMPGLDGPGALNQIRRGEGPNDITPILAFTADVEADHAGALAAMGFQGLVTKPVTPGALISAIAAALAAGVEDPEWALTEVS